MKKSSILAAALLAASILLIIYIYQMPIRKSYIFTLDTGDDILVTCDTQKGRYNFQGSDSGFQVQDKQGNVLVQGRFSYDTSFDFYRNQADLVASEVLRENDTEVMYIMTTQGLQTIKALQVPDSRVTVIMESTCDRNLAIEAIGSVTIQAEHAEEEAEEDDGGRNI